MSWQELLKQLSVPFPATLVQWRAGSTTRDKKRAQALPYAEPRIYEDRLNALCPGYAESAIIDPIRAELAAAGLPIIPAETVAAAALALFTGTASGECVVVQPGRPPLPYAFRRVPGPGSS